MARAHDVKRYPGSRLVTALFFVYLYLPIAVVVFYSFNDNKLVSVWTGFSLHWYESALHNRNLLNAVKISLTVAAIATVLATVVALMSALVLTRARDLRHRRLSETVVN